MGNTQNSTQTRLPDSIRELVWTTYHGKTAIGCCYCCGDVIYTEIGGWHCTYVISPNKGGLNNIENLRTCCTYCNRAIGDQNIYAYILNNDMLGPGSKNTSEYFKLHPNQELDTRTDINKDGSNRCDIL